MIDIGDFCIHNLLDSEIEQITNFSGEDLWQIIAKVNDCQELIEILEKKQQNNSLMNNAVRYHIKDMEEMLPIKLKLRDDFRAFFNLRREFNALMSIIEKGNMKALKNQTKKIDENLIEAIGQYEEYKTNKNRADIQKIENQLNRQKIVQQKALTNKFDEEVLILIHKMSSIKSKSFAAPLNLEEKIRRIVESVEKCQNDLKKLNNNGYFQLDAEVKSIKARIAIKNNPAAREEIKVFVEKSKQSFNFIKKIYNDANIAVKTVKEKLTQLNCHPQEEETMILKQVLEIDTELLKFEKNLINSDFEIQKFARKNHLNAKFLNTLKQVESIVQSDETISVEYLGPLFIHLKDDAIDSKLWPKLIDLSKILVFARGFSARKMMKVLKAANVSHDAFTVVGVDEFVPKSAKGNSDVFESLDHLIKDDVRFRDFLVTFLKEFVFVEDKNFNSKISEFHSALVQVPSGSVTRSAGVLEFQSDNSETLEKLKEAYEIIKDYATLSYQIIQMKSVRKDLEQALEDSRMPEHVVSPSIIYENANELVQLIQKRLITVKYLEQTKGAIEKCDEIVNSPVDDLNNTQLQDQLRIKLESKIEAEIKVWSKLEEELNSPIDEISYECTALKPLTLDGFKFLNQWTDEQENLLKLYQKLHAILNRQSDQLKAELRRLHALEESHDTSAKVEEMDIRFKISNERVKQYQVDVVVNEIEEFLNSCTKDKARMTNEKIYAEFSKKPNSEVADELIQVHEKLMEIDHVALMPQETYTHLAESIDKIVEYSRAEVRCKRNRIASKAYPFLNQSVVKMLKDTVGNYQTSFRAILSEFVERSALFFFTQGVFDEIKHDDFSWNCFDLTRLKAMDFVIEWKPNMREKISSDALKKVKTVMLVLHVINYLSIFKFLLLDESFFEKIDENLANSLREYFKVVSSFVQIVIVKKSNNNSMETPENELMDVSM